MEDILSVAPNALPKAVLHNTALKINDITHYICDIEVYIPPDPFMEKFTGEPYTIHIKKKKPKQTCILLDKGYVLIRAIQNSDDGSIITGPNNVTSYIIQHGYTPALIKHTLSKTTIYHGPRVDLVPKKNNMAYVMKNLRYLLHLDKTKHNVGVVIPLWLSNYELDHINKITKIKKKHIKQYIAAYMQGKERSKNKDDNYIKYCNKKLKNKDICTLQGILS